MKNLLFLSAPGQQQKDQQNQQHGDRHDGRHQHRLDLDGVGGDPHGFDFLDIVDAVSANQQPVGIDAVGVQVTRVQ